jgi:tRNA threonylcarbamoyladenosine biosynthesis protein TsaB
VKFLALDTATENCSAALLMDGNVRSREVEMERGHAERILPMINELLSEAGLRLSDLDAIAFGRGPGSFTGVRLAATVTQGLAFGANLGVVPISDLQAVAQRAFATDPTLTRALVCNDARMGEVYWGCYEKGEGGLARIEGEEHVSKPSEVKLPPAWSDATAVGRGFIAYAQALRQAVPAASFVAPAMSSAAPSTSPASTADAAPSVSPASTADAAPGALPVDNFLLRLLPHARQIALLAVPEVAAGRLLPPDAALPIYLRDNVAHVAQPSKRLGQGP